uniref:Uncharacterized protein n=1 Tax=Octopus bimaculoides TaxID=37653 RepID=A0A0L8GG22_OCTBM
MKYKLREKDQHPSHYVEYNRVMFISILCKICCKRFKCEPPYRGPTHRQTPAERNSKFLACKLKI